MPACNQFRHQSYPPQPVVAPIKRTLNAIAADDLDCSDLHAELGISRVLIVHGTFMGDDPFGIAEVLQQTGSDAGIFSTPLRHMAEMIRQNSRPLTTRLTGDVGNYTSEYRDEFQRLAGGDPLVELLEPAWSGQNHHLARADLAVRLFCWLNALHIAEDDRILFWGHSHAGNAFALLSNLLANERQSVEQFFAAAGPHVGEHWQKCQRILATSASPHPASRNLLIAAFGTPVRYGWDTAGYRSLVHVLHHRPDPPLRDVDGAVEPSPNYLTKPLYPSHSPAEIINASYGDWVQAFAIAGTDTSTLNSTSINSRLGTFLESSLPIPEWSADVKWLSSPELRNLCTRWKTGTRCHADGSNLLVDYNRSGRKYLGMPLETSLLGHGVATSTTWLPAHLRLVSEFLKQSLN